MNIAFRVDASVQIGTGHVMRCLTLAKLLQKEGCYVLFISRKTDGNLLDFIKDNGFTTYSIEDDSFFNQSSDVAMVTDIITTLEIDLLIVDHYQIDFRWETALRPYTKRIFVIDDLADRQHDCDILLDQNFYNGMERRYKVLVPDHCHLLLGPKYLLLRDEFYQTVSKEMTVLKRLLIFFGGSDPTNETLKALQALQNLQLDNINIDVVVGSSNPMKEEIEKLAQQLGAHYHCQINYLANLMAKADLSLGAGGSTMWERCFVGLPSTVTIVAENQRASTEAVANFGAIHSLGWYEDITVKTYEDVVVDFIENQHRLKQMQEKGFQLLGKDDKTTGKTHPVIKTIKEISDNN